MHCHRPPEPAHAVTALVRGEHPLQGTEGRSEAGHHPFQRKSIEVLVLNTQRVCQVSILLLYYCKFHPRGLQSLADLTFCSHVLSLTCDPSSLSEPSHALAAVCWCPSLVAPRSNERIMVQEEKWRSEVSRCAPFLAFCIFDVLLWLN